MVADMDGKPGETVSLSATATDLDGAVSSEEWLIGGSVVATAPASLCLVMVPTQSPSPCNRP